MNKKTIVISALSSLLVTGGIAGTAAVLINAASKNDGMLLNKGVKFTKEDISILLDSFQKNKLIKTNTVLSNLKIILKMLLNQV